MAAGSLSSAAAIADAGGFLWRSLEERRLIHGGAVKLIHLRDAFAWNEETFNLLYLVSSAPPAFAEDLLDRCENLGIPLVWNQNGVAYPAWAGKDTNRYNDPMRRLRARAKFVVYQSAFCRDSAERFLGHSGAASEVLLNPVDLSKFSPGSRIRFPPTLSNCSPWARMDTRSEFSPPFVACAH